MSKRWSNYFNKRVILENQNNLDHMLIKMWSFINLNKNIIIKNYITYNISFLNEISYKKIMKIINKYDIDNEYNNYNILCNSTFTNSDSLYNFIESFETIKFIRKDD